MGVAGMRAVLQKAPDEVILSAVGPAAGAAREVSAEGLRFELEKKTRVLGLFYELSRTLGSVFTLTDVYEKAIAILLQVTPAARVMIYQKAERGEMRHMASRARGGAAAVNDLTVQPLRVSKTVFCLLYTSPSPRD